MKTNFAIRLLIVVGVLGVGAAWAADIWQDNNNLFSVNAVFGFNLKAGFQNTQALPPNPGPATGTQVDRFYDDGYVRVDISGNEGGKTTFWGYQNNGQYNAEAGTIAMTYDTPANYGRSVQVNDAPQMGVEFGYARRLVRVGNQDRPWLIVGLEGGFTFLNLTFNDTAHFVGNQVTTDQYSLGDTVPPLAPYAGTFEGPGPLLGSEPLSRNFSIGTGTAIINNQLDGEMLVFKLGPRFELPLGRSAALTLSAGLAVVEVNADYAYSETVTSGAGQALIGSASSTMRQWDAGFYARAGLAVQLSTHWQAMAGIQYQGNGQFSTQAGNYQARLDLRDGLYATIGLGFSF